MSQPESKQKKSVRTLMDPVHEPCSLTVYLATESGKAFVSREQELMFGTL